MGASHGPVHPLRPYYIAGFSNSGPMRRALAAVAEHGILWRHGYWYAAEAGGEKYAARTVEKLARLHLVNHRMRQSRHFYVTLTALGRMFTQGNTDFAKDIIIQNAMRNQRL